ncbi:hypothetical protein EXS71_01395 [Candidatus Uhrbacteria bacterium]|nr:hypothetical protein [Candidatus Uhrbacteria bacterium]
MTKESLMTPLKMRVIRVTTKWGGWKIDGQEGEKGVLTLVITPPRGKDMTIDAFTQILATWLD